MHKSVEELEFRPDPLLATELSDLERLKNQHIFCGHSNAFILIGSSSFLQVTRTTIKSLMSLKFGQIQ